MPAYRVEPARGVAVLLVIGNAENVPLGVIHGSIAAARFSKKVPVRMEGD